MVHFFGKKSNLHSVWDSGIIDHRIYFEFQNKVQLYVNSLMQKLNQEPYKSAKKKWKKCSIDGEFLCPIEWGKESALLACKIAYPGVENNSSLGWDYYNRTVNIVDERILMAGVRLANILEKKLQITFFEKWEMFIYSLILVITFIVGGFIFLVIFTAMYFRKEYHEGDSSYKPQIDEIDVENTQEELKDFDQ